MNDYFTFPKYICRFTLFRAEEYCGSPSAAPKDLNLQKPRDCATNLIWATSDKYWSNFKYNCKCVRQCSLQSNPNRAPQASHSNIFRAFPGSPSPIPWPCTMLTSHPHCPPQINHIKIRQTSFSFPYLEQELLGEKGCEVPNTCMCTSAQKVWQLLGKSGKPVVSLSQR